MKMKSLKTQFIGAIAMVLVAAIAMGSSTYAWFAMNAEVSATGMQVSATTDGSLYIDKSDEQPSYSNITAGTVAFDGPAQPLRPTSTVDLTNWYYSNALVATDYAKATATTYSAIPSPASNYYLKKTVWIRSEKDFTSLNVKGVTITPTYGTTTEAQKVLDKALTVAVDVRHITPVTGANVTPTDAAKFFSNEDPSGARHGGVTAGDTPTLTTLTFVQANSELSTPQAIWTKAEGGAEVKNNVFAVDIYIYFDGESSSCYSNALLNAISLSANVGVTFATA